jgi:DNA repair protein RecO (recombination protein O)
MNWSDSGYLISKNRYNENSIIAEFFTKERGKISGIIFGGTSKKIKNYLQIGNKLHINYNSKNENRTGYFKIEILEACTPRYFDNNKKLSCISSGMNLIKILTAEAQANLDVYNLLEKFFIILSNDNWVQEYIFWELKLLSYLGYDLEIENLVEKNIVNNEIEYSAKSSIEKKIVPNFFIDKSIKVIDNETLLKGLKLVGDYLEKTVLKPNNLNSPINRNYFINTLK